MVQREHPPSHLDLLQIARDLRAAVATDDDDALHAELCRLRNALVEHLQSERRDLALGSDPVSTLVTDGQHRLLRLVNELLFGPRATPEQCNCVLRAAEVDVALRRQAQLEAVVRGRQTRHFGTARHTQGIAE